MDGPKSLGPICGHVIDEGARVDPVDGFKLLFRPMHQVRAEVVGHGEQEHRPDRPRTVVQLPHIHGIEDHPVDVECRFQRVPKVLLLGWWGNWFMPDGKSMTVMVPENSRNV